MCRFVYVDITGSINDHKLCVYIYIYIYILQSTRLHLFDKKYRKNCNILKYHYILTVLYLNIF